MLLRPGGSPSEADERLRRELLEGAPYRLLGRIGEGGMGEVFEAEHRTLGHRVVVKVLREPYTERDDLRDRLRVEGQALARIRHPHLVMVTDFGETRSGRPYIVMERLEGRSLRDELSIVPVLRPAYAAEIARQMLHGLHAAHEAGLVHRDIKPDNVFLCDTQDGRPFVKVLDFGVVKIAQAGRDPRTPTPLAVPTGDNMSLGSPRFFSPEQAKNEKDLDRRSDLYAVGLVLYVMIAGRGPFDDREQLHLLLRAHVEDEPVSPSSRSMQPIPPALERIVMKALRKKRDDRYPDAVAFADDLGRLLASLGDEGQRFGGALPLLVPALAPRSFGDRTTLQASAAIGPEDPTWHANGAAPGGGTVPLLVTGAGQVAVAPIGASAANAGSAADPQDGQRSGGVAPTVLDVPGVPRGSVPAHLPVSGPTPIPARTPVSAPPAAPSPASAPSPGAAPARGVLPETVQMFVLPASVQRPSAPPSAPASGAVVVGTPQVIAGPTAGSPEATPGYTVALPTLRRPEKRASWKVPALVAGALALLGALVVLWSTLR